MEKEKEALIRMKKCLLLVEASMIDENAFGIKSSAESLLFWAEVYKDLKNEKQD